MTMSDLIASIRKYRPDEVKRLLQENVDINAIDGTGDTPLMAAVRCSRLDLAQLLLDREADISIKMHSFMNLSTGVRVPGETVMEWAVQRNRQEAVAMLEKHEQALIIKRRDAAEAFRHATTSQKQEALKATAARRKLQLKL